MADLRPHDSLMAYLRNRFGVFRPADMGWAHAVNDRSSLVRALSDQAAIAIEADISRSSDGALIAAHPPATESDLSLKDLLNAVISSGRVIKLDFKDPSTVEPCLRLLSQMRPVNPVILNIDALAAPGAATPRFDGRAFIGRCQAQYPAGLLSIGWTTTRDSAYEDQDIDQMIELCRGVSQMTFPVRAGLAAGSSARLSRLVGQGRTLTIWNAEPPDQALLQSLATFDPLSTFCDLTDQDRRPLRDVF